MVIKIYDNSEWINKNIGYNIRKGKRLSEDR